MAKKLMCISVRGKRHTWGFAFMGDTDHLREWQQDGLDVSEIEGWVPEWAVNFGLTRPYLFLRDIWSLRNPFRN